MKVQNHEQGEEQLLNCQQAFIVEENINLPESIEFSDIDGATENLSELPLIVHQLDNHRSKSLLIVYFNKYTLMHNY